jgi:probable rRNA maturation factor
VHEFQLQLATQLEGVPSTSKFRKWVETTLEDSAPIALVVRVVDEDESRELNCRYRGKDAPTNVLSFTADVHEAVGSRLLGDIVICAPQVLKEAAEQGKAPEAHWAHLTIHGVLHLLGHDHGNKVEARRMESKETGLLGKLGYPDPYKNINR